MTSAVARRPRARRRRVLRVVAVLTILVVAALIIAGAIIIPRLTAEPEWWTPTLAADADAARLAEDAEEGMTRVLSKDREPGQTWTIELTEEQANAWLATRLERWARSQHTDWPSAVRGVRVSFDSGAITIGVAADIASSTRYASLTIEPRSTPDAPVRLRLVGARLGVQPVPLSALRAAMADHIPRGSLPPALAEAIRMGESALPGVFVIDADRSVRITAITAEPSRLLITCATPAD